MPSLTSALIYGAGTGAPGTPRSNNVQIACDGNGSIYTSLVANNAVVNAVSTTTSGIAPTNALATAAFAYLYDGTSWYRAPSLRATNMDITSAARGLIVASPGEWTALHTPAQNTRATCTRAANAATVHVCRSITASLHALQAATEGFVQLNLRDGLTGAGTILWAMQLHAIPTGTTSVAISGLSIVGTLGNAMTLEFVAAGGASTIESVAMTGFDMVS
jgi:hypothetical protein